METVKEQSKAEALLPLVSPELRGMMDRYVKFYMELKNMFEDICIKAEKEGFTDSQTRIMMRWLIKDLPIPASEKTKMLKTLEPIKEIRIDKVTSTASVREEIKLIHCDFYDVNKDPEYAKKRLCDIIMKSDNDKGFDVQLLGESILGFVSS